MLLCKELRIEIDFFHSSVQHWDFCCGIDEGLGLNGQTYSSWMIGGDCVLPHLQPIPKETHPMNPFGKKP